MQIFGLVVYEGLGWSVAVLVGLLRIVRSMSSVIACGQILRARAQRYVTRVLSRLFYANSDPFVALCETYGLIMTAPICASSGRLRASNTD